MKVVGYVRVSSEEQASTGFSLAAQEAKLRAYCDLYDLELVAVHVDAGVSAKTLKRPALQAALQALDGGQAEGLLIAKLDRLTRSVADWNSLIDRYFAKQVALLSVADQIDTRTAGGRLVLNVLVSVAQWEREATGERTKAVLAHKKAQGQHVGYAGLGSQIGTDGRLQDRADEAATVARMRELAAAGLTLRAIAATLEAEHFKTRKGGKWAAETVRKVLAREVG